MFDTLDYAQWKNDLERWTFFENILLEVVKRYFKIAINQIFINFIIVQNKRDDSVRNCIKGNWKIRVNYWPAYHFRIKYKSNDLNRAKVIIAAILIGPRKNYSNKNFYLFYYSLFFLKFVIM